MADHYMPGEGLPWWDGSCIYEEGPEMEEGATVRPRPSGSPQDLVEL